MSGAEAITVAPRELADLVYRCARTAGIDAGLAADLAAHWTDAALLAASTDPVTAAAQGVPVDRVAFECLCRGAESFLVAEQLLDQIAET